MAERAIFDGERKEWVEFDEDTEVLIRFISKEELREIGKATDKAARNRPQDRAEIFSRNFALKSVLGWRKIGEPSHPGFTLKGQPFPFNEENLLTLIQKDYDFSQKVGEYGIDAHYFLEREKERERKNS